MNVDLLTGELEDRSSLFQMIPSGRQAQGPLRGGSAKSNEISKRDRQRKIRKLLLQPVKLKSHND